MENTIPDRKLARRRRRNLVAKHSKHRDTFHRTRKEYKRKGKHGLPVNQVIDPDSG